MQVDIEKYRENGFINMDKLINENKEIIKSIKREIRGSQNRDKDWINVNEKSILLRTENMSEDNVNNIVYSELLSEEIARQVGIEAAHYDLITYKGKKGVLSECICKPDEELITISSLLNRFNITKSTEDSMDFIAIENVMKVINKLASYDSRYSKEDIEKLKQDFLKIAVYDLFTLNTDRNGQNFSIIHSNDGIKMAPIYDNEHSLGANLDEDIINEININSKYARLRSDMLIPVIECLEETNKEISDNWKDYSPRYEERNSKPYNWQALVFLIGEDSGYDEITDFFNNCYNNIDIDKAITEVEKRIGESIPENYKRCVNKLYEERSKFINDALILDEMEYEI